MSPLLPDSAILLQIYSHSYNTTSAGLVQLFAGPCGKPGQGSDPGEQENSLVGKKGQNWFPVQFSTQSYKQPYQDKMGKRGWKEAREAGPLLKQTLQLRCS